MHGAAAAAGQRSVCRERTWLESRLDPASQQHVHPAALHDRPAATSLHRSRAAGGVCLPESFSGWRETGLPLLDFLSARGRVLPGVDLVLNVLGFLPLGFVMGAGDAPPRARTCVLLTVLLCSLLSLRSGNLQNFRRRGSLRTSTWAATRAWCAARGAGRRPRRLRSLRPPRLAHRWRMRRILRGHPRADTGLMLLALWLFTNWRRNRCCSASGDLRNLLALPLRFRSARRSSSCASKQASRRAICWPSACSRAMMREPSPGRSACSWCSGLAAATSLRSGSSWTTFQLVHPGAALGLAIGVPLLGWGCCPRLLAQIIGGHRLWLVATALVNLSRRTISCAGQCAVVSTRATSIFIRCSSPASSRFALGFIRPASGTCAAMEPDEALPIILAPTGASLYLLQAPCLFSSISVKPKANPVATTTMPPHPRTTRQGPHRQAGDSRARQHPHQSHA